MEPDAGFFILRSYNRRGIMKTGPKILVVEDNYLLAVIVCDFLRECGVEPVGPAPGLEDGLAYARQEPLSGAILDIDLNGRLCFPICSVLAKRAVPFAFLTGYNQLSIIPAPFSRAPFITKPFLAEEMRYALDLMLSDRWRRQVRAASS
jgi:DNA-binding response OmpR family regulator